MAAPDDVKIVERLDAATRSALHSLELFASTASTNAYLATSEAPPAGQLRVAIADEQTAGRGRQGREWVSPSGSGLYQSHAYTFTSTRSDLSALTLALGVAAIEALADCGHHGVGLKWPNDLVAEDGKLGGLLTETRVDAAGVVVIAGIGINLSKDERIDVADSSRWAQRAVALADLPGPATSRNALAAAMSNRMFSAFATYETLGFAAYKEAWSSADWLRGRRLRIESPASVLEGIAAGVDDSGALRLDTAAGQVAVSSGVVNLADAKR